MKSKEPQVYAWVNTPRRLKINPVALDCRKLKSEFLVGAGRGG